MSKNDKGSSRAKVVVLGGGYAGLSCLIELSRIMPETERHLVDANVEHCKVTNLHKTVRQPLSRFCIPYEKLEKRFRFKFHRHRLSFEPANLAEWQNDKVIRIDNKALEFEYLVICTGAKNRRLQGGRFVHTQDDLRKGKGSFIIEDFLARCSEKTGQITIVGGGATGIQVLFELRDFFRTKNIRHSLRLVHSSNHLTPAMPSGFHRYIAKKVRMSGIEYLSRTKYLGQSKNQAHLECLDSGKRLDVPSDLTFLFAGVTPSPGIINANSYGQIEHEGNLFPNFFTAGDCSHYSSSGLNRMTAQTAVRKGKIVAENIHKMHAGNAMQKYRYKEAGYFICLGRQDGIGWVGFKFNLIKGLPAAGIKEMLELQYDLFLKGLDTYGCIPPRF